MSKSYRGTIIRSIRIADPLWEKAKEKAEDEGRSLSDVIREALEQYVGEGQ